MLYRCLELLVTLLYAMPIVGLVALLLLPLPRDLTLALIAVPIMLLCLACVAFAHVCIIHTVRKHTGTLPGAH
jgi:hypothetical protein